MKNCVLSIDVLCETVYRVEGSCGDANMVLFSGKAEHPNFTGVVLPGGCDTQKRDGNTVSMSARYMLQGKDCDGQDCHIFIENNGSFLLPPTDAIIKTVPTVRTDSKALAWLETAVLSGTVTPKGENRVFIEIFAEDEK